MDISLKTGATPQPQVADRVAARAPAANVPTDAASAKLEINKAATQAFQVKSQVSSDMERLQQNFEASVNQLNNMLKGSGRNLSINMDHALNTPIVTVRNSESGEVIRQIPNETVVQIAHSIEAFKGWLHDVKV